MADREIEVVAQLLVFGRELGLDAAGEIAPRQPVEPLGQRIHHLALLGGEAVLLAGPGGALLLDDLALRLGSLAALGRLRLEPLHREAILTEDLDGTRHGADLATPRLALDLDRIIAGGEIAHARLEASRAGG
ncbi:hypothetical protein BTHI11S_02176 [Bosea thiooxidans]